MDYEKSYSNPATAKPPQALNGFAGSRPTSVQAIAANGMPRIPRATTADSWDRNTNLEMMPSNSRQNLVPVGQNSVSTTQKPCLVTVECLLWSVHATLTFTFIVEAL